MTEFKQEWKDQQHAENSSSTKYEECYEFDTVTTSRLPLLQRKATSIDTGIN